NLTDQLLVDTFDDDISLAGGFHGNALRQLIFDRGRKAQCQGQRLTLGSCTITHTDPLQLALEALAYAADPVVGQSAASAGHGRIRTSGTRCETQLALFLDQFNGRMHGQIQSTLGALDRYFLTFNLYFYTLWQFDRVLGDARHRNALSEYGAEYFAADTGSASGTI